MKITKTIEVDDAEIIRLFMEFVELSEPTDEERAHWRVEIGKVLSLPRMEHATKAPIISDGDIAWLD